MLEKKGAHWRVSLVSNYDKQMNCIIADRFNGGHEIVLMTVQCDGETHTYEIPQIRARQIVYDMNSQKAGLKIKDNMRFHSQADLTPFLS